MGAAAGAAVAAAQSGIWLRSAHYPPLPAAAPAAMAPLLALPRASSCRMRLQMAAAALHAMAWMPPRILVGVDVGLRPRATLLALLLPSSSSIARLQQEDPACTYCYYNTVLPACERRPTAQWL